MGFIKPLDKDIYNLADQAIIAKNRVFGLLQVEYDGKISKVVDSLNGLSVEERVKTFDRLLERLPSIEYIEKLCRRAMDEARGERQKLEYPLGKFLKEKYPELTVQDIQNSPTQQFVDTEWRAELCKRYPEIDEAYKNLPKVQNPALETLRVLSKLKFFRDQEFAKLEAKCMPTDIAAPSGKVGKHTEKENKSLVLKINWIPEKSELEELITQLKGSFFNYISLEDVISGKETLGLIGNNKAIDGLVFFYVLAERGKITIREHPFSDIEKTFNIKAVKQQNEKIGNPIKSKKINEMIDFDDRFKTRAEELKKILKI